MAIHRSRLATRFSKRLERNTVNIPFQKGYLNLAFRKPTFRLERQQLGIKPGLRRVTCFFAEGKVEIDGKIHSVQYTDFGDGRKELHSMLESAKHYTGRNSVSLPKFEEFLEQVLATLES